MCLRIGPRWHKECCAINTPNGPITWKQETMYLGVTLLAGKCFKVSFEKSKSTFYRSFNAIYSQLGKINSPMVTLNLISTIALPCLLYATEALPFNVTLFKELEHPWSRVFMRVFGTFSNETVFNCKYFSGHLPVEHMIRLRKINFIRSLAVSKK